MVCLLLFFVQLASISSSPCYCLVVFFQTFRLNIGSLKVRQLTHSPSLYSAEAVAGMIKAHIFGKSWNPPGWLPKRYLTWATEE